MLENNVLQFKRKDMSDLEIKQRFKFYINDLCINLKRSEFQAIRRLNPSIKQLTEMRMNQRNNHYYFELKEISLIPNHIVISDDIEIHVNLNIKN